MVLATQLYGTDEKLNDLKELAYENNDRESLELIESLERNSIYNQALNRIDEVCYGFRDGEYINDEFYYKMDNTSNDDKFDLLENELDCLFNMRLIDKCEYDKLHQVIEYMFLEY